MSGNYLLNVTWAGRLVKGCPLRITAESEDVGNENTAAAKVIILIKLQTKILEKTYSYNYIDMHTVYI